MNQRVRNPVSAQLKRQNFAFIAFVSDLCSLQSQLLNTDRLDGFNLFYFESFRLPNIAMVPLEKDIPPVYQICETLGFDINDNKELINATQEWRRTWISETGLPDSTLR